MTRSGDVTVTAGPDGHCMTTGTFPPVEVLPCLSVEGDCSNKNLAPPPTTEQPVLQRLGLAVIQWRWKDSRHRARGGHLVDEGREHLDRCGWLVEQFLALLLNGAYLRLW